MIKFILAIVMASGLGSARAAPLDADLSGAGAFDAVTINGFTLPLADVQILQDAGVLRIDPVTQRFSFAPDITSERALKARLAALPLARPSGPRDLYRAAKVALPNSAAHTLTVPSGFGPAHFANQPGRATLSASLGGVNRVPYTSSGDGALGLGLSFGNSFDGIGAAVMVSANDLSQIDNLRRMSWGIELSHYFADGVSLSLGGENLFVQYTDGQDSYYVTGSWAFDPARSAMPFRGVWTLGAGSGRFATATPRDRAEGRMAKGTAVFTALAWQVTDRLNLIAEWNGRNLNSGIAYTLPRTGISLKLGVENLTSSSGNGPILTGSVGVTLIRF